MAGSPAESRLRHISARGLAPRRPPSHARPTADEARIEKTLLADLAPPDVLMRALHCADIQGVAVLDALIACTAADPNDVTARLARRFGVEVLAAFDFPPDILSASAASAAMQAGVLRLPDGRFIIAPRGRPAVELARLLDAAPHVSHRIRLAPPALFMAAVLHASGTPLAEEAAEGPSRLDAVLSARNPRIARVCALGAAVLGLGAIVATIFVPLTMTSALGTLFLVLTMLRLLGVRPYLPERALPRLPDDFLPVYTLLVPLHRERACLTGLVGALSRLDYPEAKLDIKLLVEADDCETFDALSEVALPGFFEIVPVPPGSPRTKPRALNVGLALARGSLLGVFDAEDRPDTGQLREAVNAFLRGGPRLGCVQARLVIDNVADSWITRVFALEYAGLFDALLPALSRSNLFLPLGGTSNHFRTAVLDRIGGWDAWNVTEDADLGVRLARMGYRVRVIASSTLEEAPNTASAWLRQRTRWLKGYMLTWAVHMRRPVRLYRELGLLNFLTFNAFIGGIPASALILPVFVLGVIDHAATGIWLSLGVLLVLDSSNLVLGFCAPMVLAAIGAERRRLHTLIVWIPTMVLYWPLCSLAAWRGVWQLLRVPFFWEKTEHGLARTSRSGAATPVRGPGRLPRRSRNRASSYSAT